MSHKKMAPAKAVAMLRTVKKERKGRKGARAHKGRY